MRKQDIKQDIKRNIMKKNIERPVGHSREPAPVRRAMREEQQTPADRAIRGERQALTGRAAREDQGIAAGRAAREDLSIAAGRGVREERSIAAGRGAREERRIAAGRGVREERRLSADRAVRGRQPAEGRPDREDSASGSKRPSDDYRHTGSHRHDGLAGRNGDVRQRSGQRRHRENRPILLISWLFIFMFLGMSGYICYYAAANKQEMVNNNYNGMQRILMEQNSRGTIFASGGEVLAETRLDDTGAEVRSYPYENLFAHVVGYATKGKAGIEARANYYLLQSSISFPQKAANAAAERKNPGDAVCTNLQVELQDIASKSLGAYKGAVIVTEPSTGKILAMVSKPDYNPDQIADLWEDLLADKDSGVLLNRASQGLYPPGSTFKIITALEYYREKQDEISAYHYNCSGSFSSGGDSISCYHGSVHGQVDFMKSFAKSCNSSFGNIGLSLERDRFADTLDNLLFGRELPLGVNYNKSMVPVSADTPDKDMLQISIGQGAAQITPLHLNMITCAIANQGVLMEPYLVDMVKDYEGNIVKQFTPTVYGQLMKEDEARLLRDLMEEVVRTGTATRLQDGGYTAAGKTGSAEFGVVKGESHAWFTGYAPADDPQICVTIIIEGAGAGGDYAVPVAKRIFDAYLGTAAEQM